MPFATVKSDPYAKPKRRPRKRLLWTEAQWKRLVKASGADEPVNDEELRRLAEIQPRIEAACLMLIREFCRSDD